MKVKSNYRARELFCYPELPSEILPQFDYMDEREDEWWQPRFVKFRDNWYDVNDTEGKPADKRLSKWDAFIGESYFSCVLFRHSGDGVVVGYAHW